MSVFEAWLTFGWSLIGMVALYATLRWGARLMGRQE